MWPEDVILTLPSPGLSLTLLTALSRQGGAGGGVACRIPVKFVGKRGGASEAVGVVFCFFFLEDRLSFWAALREEVFNHTINNTVTANKQHTYLSLCLSLLSLSVSLSLCVWFFVSLYLSVCLNEDHGELSGILPTLYLMFSFLFVSLIKSWTFKVISDVYKLKQMESEGEWAGCHGQ